MSIEKQKILNEIETLPDYSFRNSRTRFRKYYFISSLEILSQINIKFYSNKI